MTTPPRTTIDGVPVKVGSVVWRVDQHVATVTSCRLYAHHLELWWERMTSKEIYSTERAALKAAIKAQRVARSKARAEVRRASKAIERLTARIRGRR